LVTEAARSGAKRVFLVVSGTLDRETTWVDEMRGVLGVRYAGSFDGMPSHTPRQSVLEATEKAREAGADLIVTFGGGSGTDAGKMIRLALKHDIRAIEDFDRFVVRVAPDGSRAVVDYEAPDVPQIAIPTTLSGGDFNPSAGATDTRTMLKEIYRHPRLVPSVIVLDPAVTVRTPQWLWLSSGIRALDHAVETVCAPAADARSRLEAIPAISLLARALPRTHQDPNDLGARLDAQLAVWLSMEHNRFGVSMGASHGIGHVLGGTCNVPHGYTVVCDAAGGAALQRERQRGPPGARGRGIWAGGRTGVARGGRICRRTRITTQPRRGRRDGGKVRDRGKGGDAGSLFAHQSAANPRGWRHHGNFAYGRVTLRWW
jgi:maleylacetate reductase